MNKLVNTLTSGNRPIRIFIFGGIFIAYILMKLLGSVFGLDTSLDENIGLAEILLIAASILIGFGSSFSIIHILESLKESDENKGREE